MCHNESSMGSEVLEAGTAMAGGGSSLGPEGVKMFLGQLLVKGLLLPSLSLGEASHKGFQKRNSLKALGCTMLRVEPKAANQMKGTGFPDKP